MSNLEIQSRYKVNLLFVNLVFWILGIWEIVFRFHKTIFLTCAMSYSGILIDRSIEAKDQITVFIRSFDVVVDMLITLYIPSYHTCHPNFEFSPSINTNIKPIISQ
jgi:hypothetical protein